MDFIVFDLDGTLLNQHSQISSFTRDTLIKLNDNNIAYTVATGRALYSGQAIIDGHGFTLPHIYSNGVVTWDPQHQTLDLDNFLTVDEASYILETTLIQNVTPFISVVDEQHQHFIFHPAIQNPAEARLLETFRQQGQITVLPIDAMPTDARVTNISMIGDGDEIDRIFQSTQTKAHLIAYSGPAIEGNGLKWMDIHHNEANKGTAVQRLANQLGASRVICFGDSDNDLSMFAQAHESYAMANANDEIKAAATGVIGYHHEDGVAHYLREHYQL